MKKRLHERFTYLKALLHPSGYPWFTLPLILFFITVMAGICDEFARKFSDGNLRPTGYDGMIRRAVDRHMPRSWDWRIFKAQVYQESRFNPNASSSAGARGLCQLMPLTGQEMGYSSGELLNPHKNLDAGAGYMRKMWDAWSDVGDSLPGRTRTRLTLASYNAGLSRIQHIVDDTGTTEWNVIKPHLPEETQLYVELIMDNWYPECRQLHAF